VRGGSAKARRAGELQKWANLKAKHIDHVIERFKVEDTGKRSIESRLSHLRWLVQKIGKANLVPRSNAELGVEPGPRKTRAGKRISDERFREIVAAIADPRLKLALHLGRYLGMRFREAMLFRPGRDIDGERVCSSATRKAAGRATSGSTTHAARRTARRGRHAARMARRDRR